MNEQSDVGGKLDGRKSHKYKLTDNNEDAMSSERRIIHRLAAFVAFIAIIVIVVFIYRFYGLWPRGVSDFGATGDYFGGLLNPLFGFFTICLLIWSLRFQIKELIETRKAVQGQVEELSQTKKIHTEQCELTKQQIKYGQKQHQFEQARFYDELYQHELSELKVLLNREVFVGSKEYLPNKMLPTVNSVIEELKARAFSNQALFYVKQLAKDDKYDFHKFEIQTQFQRLSAFIKPYLETEVQEALAQTRVVGYLTILQKLMLINVITYHDVLYLDEYICDKIFSWHKTQKAKAKTKQDEFTEYCKGNIRRTVKDIAQLIEGYSAIRKEYPELKFDNESIAPQLLSVIESIEEDIAKLSENL